MYHVNDIFLDATTREDLFTSLREDMANDNQAQRVHVIHGKGGNGKSTFSRALINAVGYDKSQRVSARELVQGRVDVTDKTRLIIADDGGDLTKEGAIDWASLKRFLETCKCAIVMLCQQPPNITDDGVARRVKLYHAKNQFDGRADPAEVIANVTEEIKKLMASNNQ